MFRQESQIQKVYIILKELKKLFPKANKTILTYTTPWELLVGVILSAQCTDKQVNRVTEKLFKKYKTLDDYVQAKTTEFEKDIRSTGFYKSKTKNILAAAKIIKEKHNGQVPKTIGELVSVPGVGRKTANVVLGNAFGIVQGIAVDTHVKRLSRYFKLTAETHPDKIEKELMKIVPQKEWFNFTNLMIAYGRKYQTARTKNTDELPLTKTLRNAKMQK